MTEQYCLIDPPDPLDVRLATSSLRSAGNALRPLLDNCAGPFTLKHHLPVSPAVLAHEAVTLACSPPDVTMRGPDGSIYARRWNIESDDADDIFLESWLADAPEAHGYLRGGSERLVCCLDGSVILAHADTGDPVLNPYSGGLCIEDALTRSAIHAGCGYRLGPDAALRISPRHDKTAHLLLFVAAPAVLDEEYFAGDVPLHQQGPVKFADQHGPQYSERLRSHIEKQVSARA